MDLNDLRRKLFEDNSEEKKRKEIESFAENQDKLKSAGGLVNYFSQSQLSDLQNQTKFFQSPESLGIFTQDLFSSPIITSSEKQLEELCSIENRFAKTGKISASDAWIFDGGSTIFSVLERMKVIVDIVKQIYNQKEMSEGETTRLQTLLSEELTSRSLKIELVKKGFDGGVILLGVQDRIGNKYLIECLDANKVSTAKHRIVTELGFNLERKDIPKIILFASVGVSEVTNGITDNISYSIDWASGLCVLNWLQQSISK